MTTNVVNQMPYLQTSRNFPLEAQPLAVEVNKSYVDIANSVNNRMIGLYPTNRPAINGESWFINDNQRQQAFRQIYTFTAAGSIPHGINFNSVSFISPKSCGSYTDSTNWYGVIYASSTTITDQVSFYVTSTNIVVQADAGAPSITNGIIVLEWLSQF